MAKPSTKRSGVRRHLTYKFLAFVLYLDDRAVVDYYLVVGAAANTGDVGMHRSM